METVTTSRWLDKRRGKSSFQIRALEQLGAVAWDAMQRVLLATSLQPHFVLHAVVAFRVLSKLRIFRRDKEQDELIRSALECVVVLAGQRLADVSVDTGERIALRDGAMVLAVCLVHGSKLILDARSTAFARGTIADTPVRTALHQF